MDRARPRWNVHLPEGGRCPFHLGPFREAAESELQGDRKAYQMNPMNRREAVLESLEDERQGADALMVKPAGAYLHIIRDIREATRLPLGAYQVSGEYAMIKFAAVAGTVDEARVVRESIGAIKRGRRRDIHLLRHGLRATGVLTAAGGGRCHCGAPIRGIASAQRTTSRETRTTRSPRLYTRTGAGAKRRFSNDRNHQPDNAESPRYRLLRESENTLEPVPDKMTLSFK